MFPSEKDFSIGDPQINDGIKTQYKVNKKMTKKIFSIKDDTLLIRLNGLFLKNISIIACTNDNYCIKNNCHYITPSTLIPTPKSDEELAEEEFPYYEGSKGIELAHQHGFVKGRESVKGEFHLTRKEVEKIFETGRNFQLTGENYLNELLSSFPLPIYPHTIEVEHDGINYLWETLKAIY
jgi:hypothetical protein